MAGGVTLRLVNSEGLSTYLACSATHGATVYRSHVGVVARVTASVILLVRAFRGRQSAHVFFFTKRALVATETTQRDGVGSGLSG